MRRAYQMFGDDVLRSRRSRSYLSASVSPRADGRRIVVESNMPTGLVGAVVHQILADRAAAPALGARLLGYAAAAAQSLVETKPQELVRTWTALRDVLHARPDELVNTWTRLRDILLRSSETAEQPSAPTYGYPPAPMTGVRLVCPMFADPEGAELGNDIEIPESGVVIVTYRAKPFAATLRVVGLEAAIEHKSERTVRDQVTVELRDLLLVPGAVSVLLHDAWAPLEMYQRPIISGAEMPLLFRLVVPAGIRPTVLVRVQGPPGARVEVDLALRVELVDELDAGATDTVAGTVDLQGRGLSPVTTGLPVGSAEG